MFDNFPFRTLLILLLTASSLYGQNTDSLKILISKAEHDTSRCRLLNTLVEMEYDEKIWPAYNEKLRVICEKNLKTCSKTDKLYRVYINYLANAYNNAGYLANQKGDVPEALDQYHLSLRIYEEIGDSSGLGAALNNIAFIYSDQNQTDKALEYYERALVIFKNSNEKKQYATVLINLGLLYQEKNDFAKALNYYQQTVDMGLSMRNAQITAYVYNNIGLLYANDVDPSCKEDSASCRQIGLIKGLEYCQKAVPFFEESKDKKGIAFCITNIGRIYNQLGRYAEAKEYGERGLLLANQTGFPEAIRRAAESLSLIYAATGNYKDAYSMQIVFKQMADSINSSTNRKATIQKQYQYEYVKKVAADSVRTVEKEKIIAAERKQERTQRVALIVGIIFFALLVVGLRWNIQQRKTSYEKLQEKNHEIQTQSEKLVKQSKEIAKYQSQMNPHFVFNALNSIQGYVVNEQKQKSLNQLQEFSQLMRQTLNNSDMELINLKSEFEFLRRYFSFEKDRFTRQIDFLISCEADEENVLIPPMLIQPFIENALKHAGLDQTENPAIHLELSEKEEMLQVSIFDNGKGIQHISVFQTEKPHALNIVRSRIKLLFENEGKAVPENMLEISNNPNSQSGVLVRFYLPLITRF
jgi:tetratricopeptide (TPR) repeat protein